MRSALFALILMTSVAAAAQAVTPAIPAAAPGSGLPFSSIPQQAAPGSRGSFDAPIRLLHSEPLMLAQNRLPALPLANGPAPSKPQPIPTQWPNAKFELIPTQWPNARVVLVQGGAQPAAAKSGTGAGLTENLVTAPRK